MDRRLLLLALAGWLLLSLPSAPQFNNSVEAQAPGENGISAVQSRSITHGSVCRLFEEVVSERIPLRLRQTFLDRQRLIHRCASPFDRARRLAIVNLLRRDEFP